MEASIQAGRERRECEFQLVRYVPDGVRNEYVHIGVILRAQGGSDPVQVRFTHDWRRVRCLDPDADTAQLEGMESELRRKLSEDPDGELMRILNESLSLNLQMTAPKGYLVESLPAGVDELMRMYVDAPKRERAERLSGRAAIHARMRTEFERAGVWDLMRKREVELSVEDLAAPADDPREYLAVRHNLGQVRRELEITQAICGKLLADLRDEYEDSRSWRLTKPLRALAAFIRGRRS